MIRLRLTRRSADPVLIAGRGRFTRAAWRGAAMSDITLHSRGQ